MVCWITGLSGAGKTTVARLVRDSLRAGRPDVVLLDGDALRDVLGAGVGHGLADRRAAAMRYARLCRLPAGQGLVVVCATISMFESVRAWNRANIDGYLEVYLRAPVEVLAARDPKGLYAGARRGEVRDVYGVDLVVEEPAAPDLVIDTDGGSSPAEAAARIVALAEARLGGGGP